MKKLDEQKATRWWLIQLLVCWAIIEPRELWSVIIAGVGQTQRLDQSVRRSAVLKKMQERLP